MRTMNYVGLWMVILCGFFGLDAIEPKYQTIYLDQKVDNFNFGKEETFKLRVLISEEHWNRTNGPIFFYTGNEGKITDFAENTGFMWEIAEEFGAMVVFSEHRYYGESTPPRNESMTEAEYYNYLSIEQTLADFAQVIWYLKHEYNASQSAVIAFGGSYGAMLATWMRIKYPHLVQGVISSSAPLNIDYINGTNCDSRNEITTQAFNRRSKECVQSIRQSWEIINHFTQTDAGKSFLSNTFNLCQRIVTDDDIANFKGWIVSGFFNAAMTDYPTAANFLEPLPANPTKEICKYLTNTSLESDELMYALFEAMSVYYNYTGEKACFNVSDVFFDQKTRDAWNFQFCTELTIPVCSNGINDMFEESYWDYQGFSEFCLQEFGVKPINNSLLIQYGNITFMETTNIVFSNGEFDPWSGQGILRNLSDSVISVWIKDAAHHLDLRFSSPEDPPSVIEARNIEKHFITKWIHEWNQRTNEI